MKTGELAQPLWMGDDCYLLRVAGRQASNTRAFDDALKAELKKKLEDAEEKRRYDEFVGRLRKKYYVKTFF